MAKKKSEKSNDKKYKFKDLLVYATDENMEGDTKKYRSVFDNEETTYMYWELSFYNKLFDEEDWEIDIVVKAFRILQDLSREELCVQDSNIFVSKDKNIVVERDGWGMNVPGAFWTKGVYEWEAAIDNEIVGTTRFYVENGGIISDNDNPYFNVESVKFYNGPSDGVNLTERKYLIQFEDQATRYIWVELNLKNLQYNPWRCEIFFNFYNDAGQLKGKTSQLHYLPEENQTSFTITTGWGAQHITWYKDKYTLEVIFMDQLIAIVPFEVSDEDTEGIPQIYRPTNQPFYGVPLQSISEDEPSLEEIMKELDEMIGLNSIKEKLQDFTHYMKFLKLRKEQGFEENEKMSLHSVFMGNPGTGKTTVALMLGKIYKKMGLLPTDKVIQASRVELIGNFIGQTAPKVKEMIDKARGGILFIDEAYSLARKSDMDGEDFGKEVIEVLISEMSDGKGDLAIIVAGYTDLMEIFLESNPGLKSRFNLVYHFPDYLPQELELILEFKAEKKKVIFNQESKEFIRRQLTEAYRNRDKTFGNARLVNSLVEEAKMNMGLRIIKSGEYQKMSHLQLQEIILEDVKNLFKKSKSVAPIIAVDEPMLNEALEELNLLIGLTKVKEEVLELIKLIQFYKESGRDILNKFSFHSVFIGNPGTGKTTVARIISKIYKALGVLERGQLVECDRSSLVASYVGQTAPKTLEKIKQAMGGVLFIDEAYSLNSSDENDFGKEAVETLLKQMEDRRGEFAVIAAGYPDNMKTFLESNPGLASRFDITLTFEDYKVDELYQIALSILKADNLIPDANAEIHLKKYFAYLNERRDKFFGNARSIRKVIQQAIKNQHLRMASLPKELRTEDKINSLTLEDVLEFDNTLDKGGSIGFKIQQKGMDQ